MKTFKTAYYRVAITIAGHLFDFFDVARKYLENLQRYLYRSSPMYEEDIEYYRQEAIKMKRRQKERDDLFGVEIMDWSNPENVKRHQEGQECRDFYHGRACKAILEKLKNLPEEDQKLIVTNQQKQQEKDNQTFYDKNYRREDEFVAGVSKLKEFHESQWKGPIKTDMVEMEVLRKAEQDFQEHLNKPIAEPWSIEYIKERMEGRGQKLQCPFCFSQDLDCKTQFTHYTIHIIFTCNKCERLHGTDFDEM